MKKIFGFLIISLLCFTSVQAAVVSPVVDGEFQEYINKTGFKLLNANAIEQQIVFRYSKSNSLKTKASLNKNVIYVPKGVLTFVESEDELAALIAYQTAYNLYFKESDFAGFTTKLAHKKYQTYADKRAVDFLVKAGYSPFALITTINKISVPSKINFYTEKKSVRLAKIYEYIVRKYPDKLDDKKFKDNIYYQNFLLNSRSNREVLQERLKYDPFSPKRIDYR